MMRATVYLDVLRKRRERSLRVEHVTKIYPGGARALDDVTLAFPSGICGIVGPGGAGKSTLMRILSIAEMPDRGAVHYDGVDGRAHPNRLRAVLGAVASAPPAPATLPVLVALEQFAAREGWVERRMRLAWVELKLRQVGLWERRGERVGELSEAMRWRLSVAMTLLMSPTALLIDEPSALCTPDDAPGVAALLRRLAEHRLVIVATNNAQSLRDLASHVAVLHRGRVLRDGPVDRLVDDLSGRVWRGHESPSGLRALSAQHVVLASAPAADSGVTVHVVADESPGPAFVPVEPDIQHVFQYSLAVASR